MVVRRELVVTVESAMYGSYRSGTTGHPEEAENEEEVIQKAAR